jgi:hypothetical protein
MKSREGFVSNSRSSSFIIGYGIIKDENSFKSYIKKNKIIIDGTQDYNTYQSEDWNSIISVFDTFYEMKADNRILCGGNDTELLVPQSLNNYWNKRIAIVEIHNDEGDGPPFIYEENEMDGTGNFNYEVAKKESFYSERQQSIINLFKEETGILTDCKVVIGAERNG